MSEIQSTWLGIILTGLAMLCLCGCEIVEDSGSADAVPYSSFDWCYAGFDANWK